MGRQFLQPSNHSRKHEDSLAARIVELSAVPIESGKALARRSSDKNPGGNTRFFRDQLGYCFRIHLADALIKDNYFGPGALNDAMAIRISLDTDVERRLNA